MSLRFLLKGWLLFLSPFLCLRYYFNVTTALTSPTPPSTKLSEYRKFVFRYTLAVEEKEEFLKAEYPGCSCTQYRIPDPSPDQEDELEMLYPTSRSLFVFTDESAGEVTSTIEVPIRTTSFGCGKLGYEVWTSSIFLSLYLYSNNFLLRKELPESPSDDDATTTRIVELGAGCGLPSSMLARLGTTSKLEIVATDFWNEPTDEVDPDRLIPDYYHGVNLNYNVASETENENAASVQRLDWFRPKNPMVGKVDWVIGSDLIYYPQDLVLLWNTLDMFLDQGSKILFVAPTRDKKREALPEFIQQLEAKQNSNTLKVETKDWVICGHGPKSSTERDKGDERIVETNHFKTFCFEKS